MTKWLFSLLMIFAVGSGALGGTPLRSGSEDCEMSKMMNCCKRKAAGQATPTEITRANLCRTLMCEQSGSTASTVQLPQLSTLVAAVLYFQTLKLSPSNKAKLSASKFSESPVSSYKTPLFLQHNTLRI